MTLPLEVLLRSLLTIPALGAIIFLAAGRIAYWQGWCFLAANAALIVANLILLSDRPDLLRERLSPGKGTKWWDKLYFGVTTPLYLVALVGAALDSGRFGWSPPLEPALYAAAYLVYVGGHALHLWAKRTNRFFATVVRIQSDRGQVVCSSGPYRFVRHPGYLGGLISTIVTPLLFGSLVLLPAALLFDVCLVIRTALEDRTLKAELPGYADYAHSVRFRLLPRVW